VIRLLTCLVAWCIVTGSYALVSNRDGYWRENCSEYAARIVGIGAESAGEMWNGRDLRLVGEFDSWEQARRMVPMSEGMLIAFHGAHVAVFHCGQVMDSDPRHNGVGPMQYDAGDSWFKGRVRIYVNDAN